MARPWVPLWQKRLLRRPDHHDHLAAFHLGHVLDLADFLDVLGHALQQVAPQVLVRHLAAAEPQRHLHLVARFQEPEHVAHLDVVVVHVGVGPELDLFHLDDLLLLAGFGFAFLRLVLVLAEVHDLADRRRGVGRDLDQVQPGGFGQCHGAFRRHHAHILAFRSNQSNFGCPDPVVDARSGVSGWRGIVGSASDGR